MIWRSVVAWLPGIPIAIANGALREMLYKQFLPELQAHQLSVVSFIIFFGVYVYYALPWLKPGSASAAFRVGILWLALTVAFEFVFGHYVMGHPWERLTHDYDLAAGRLWVIVLLWTALAPWLFHTIRRRRKAATASLR